ncbi:right-handed parallel beta-helix repeat-containing protein [Paenibacillus psychroresistens]|nr:right-handed parallel beta-helix repeat-containing protein [Paenibacillus psychroresistens]
MIQGSSHYFIYVALHGNDDNEGNEASPFRTITRARDALRELKISIKSDIIVYIRGGVYELDAPIVFDERDSGFNGNCITYCTYPGENVQISGAKRITGWNRVESECEYPLWKVELPWLENTRHLYVDGNSVPRPRSEEIITLGWETVTDDRFQFWNELERVTTFQGEFPVYEGYSTKLSEMVDWRNPQDIEFVYDVGWTHCIVPVESVRSSAEGTIVTMRMPCFRDCLIKGGVRISTPNYIENVFELMSKPGEWYFDRKKGELYYLSTEEESPETKYMDVPITEQLIIVKGSLECKVTNLAFCDLEFSFTTCLHPSETGHAEVQANLIKDPDDDLLLHSSYLTCPSGIVLDATDGITITGCKFHHLGTGAVDLINGTTHARIYGNRFYAIAGSGIQVGGFTFSDAHPEDPRNIVNDNVIENNYFSDIGTEFKGSVAVIAGYTEGTVIAHNEIHHVAYSGISVGWGWGYADPRSDDRYFSKPPVHYPRFHLPTVANRNRIEYNHVHHVLQKLHDGAGIYTLSLQPGSVIKGNYVHHNGNKEGMLYKLGIMVHNSSESNPSYTQYLNASGFPGGIYLDEASGGFEVSNNIMHDIVIPIFYHDVIKNGFESNRFSDNHFNTRPNEPDFPESAAMKAGLQLEFRHILNW